MSFIACTGNPDIGIWFRSVPDPDGGEDFILELDMRYGYAIADTGSIYIIVIDRKSGKEIKLAFTNGDYFSTETSFWYPGGKESYTNDECEGEDIQFYLKKGIPLEKNKK